MVSLSAEAIQSYHGKFEESSFRALHTLYCQVKGTPAEEIVVSAMIEDLRPVIAYSMKLWGEVDDADLADEMIHRAATDLIKWIMKMREGKTPDGLFKELVQRARWRMSDAWRQQTKNQIFNLEYNGKSPLDYMGVPDGAATVLNRIFCTELNALVVEHVAAKVRKRFRHFKDVSGRACSYIADRIIAGEDVVLATLRKVYHITNPVFWVDYVRTQVRDVLYDVRSQYDDCVEHDWISQVFPGAETNFAECR